MKISMRKLMTLAVMCCCLCGTAQATHDQGLGKSQDGQDGHELGSVAVAPEPSTLWIFLIGSLGLAAAFRQKSTKYQSRDR
jgi:hypothetical protein